MHGIAFKLLMQPKVAAGFTFVNTEAAAVAASFSSAPSNTRAALIDTLVGALKSGATSGSNIWAKLDFLWVLAAADSQASLVDWKGAYNLTANDAPAFTVDQGWTGDGATAGMNLSSEFNPSTATSPQWSQNSAHIGAFNLTAGVNGLVSAGASNAVVIGGSVAALGRIGTGFSSNASAPAGSPPHHICISRTGSTSQVAYRDGVGGSAQTSTGGAVSTPVFVLTNISAATPTDATISAVHGGAGLSAAEVLDLYNALQAYLHGIGAI